MFREIRWYHKVVVETEDREEKCDFCGELIEVGEPIVLEGYGNDVIGGLMDAVYHRDCWMKIVELRKSRNE